MLDLEGGGDLRLAAVEPQHVDEPDGVGAGDLLDGTPVRGAGFWKGNQTGRSA